MSDARKEKMREYRRKNRERINKQKREKYYQQKRELAEMKKRGFDQIVLAMMKDNKQKRIESMSEHRLERRRRTQEAIERELKEDLEQEKSHFMNEATA